MKKWLKNAEAAELLGINGRTVKRWMKCPVKRQALGAVKQGKQWRIPRPDYEPAWEMQTRRRLEETGIYLKPSWERALEEVARKCDRYMFESYRLWVAAYAKALGRGRVTQKARNGILLLWQQACKILDPLPRHEMQVEGLKYKFASWARAWALEHKAELNYPKSEWPRHFMRYWPSKEHFAQVRAAKTFDALEKIRRRLDLLQATRDLKRSGKKPTAENLRPLLHDDIMAHINDTREKLPRYTIKAHEPEDIRSAIKADLLVQRHSATPRRITECQDAQGKTYALIEGEGIPCVDMREPQDGLTLRTFRNRHPLRKSPQREIVATVYGARNSIPGTDDQPCVGKTPIRDSTYPRNKRSR